MFKDKIKRPIALPIMANKDIIPTPAISPVETRSQLVLVRL